MLCVYVCAVFSPRRVMWLAGVKTSTLEARTRTWRQVPVAMITTSWRHQSVLLAMVRMSLGRACSSLVSTRWGTIQLPCMELFSVVSGRQARWVGEGRTFGWSWRVNVIQLGWWYVAWNSVHTTPTLNQCRGGPPTPTTGRTCPPVHLIQFSLTHCILITYIHIHTGYCKFCISVIKIFIILIGVFN